MHRPPRGALHHASQAGARGCQRKSGFPTTLLCVFRKDTPVTTRRLLRGRPRALRRARSARHHALAHLCRRHRGGAGIRPRSLVALREPDRPRGNNLTADGLDRWPGRSVLGPQNGPDRVKVFWTSRRGFPKTRSLVGFAMASVGVLLLEFVEAQASTLVDYAGISQRCRTLTILSAVSSVPRYAHTLKCCLCRQWIPHLPGQDLVA